MVGRIILCWYAWFRVKQRFDYIITLLLDVNTDPPGVWADLGVKWQADILIRCLDFSEVWDIDLGGEKESSDELRKWYSRSIY